jgi:hypothetical protein
VSLSNHDPAGLPPAILKHAGDMLHRVIIEGRCTDRSFDTGPFDVACGVAQDMLRLRSVPTQDERIKGMPNAYEPVIHSTAALACSAVVS